MKTIVTAKPNHKTLSNKTEKSNYKTRLFRPDLKFMDFYHVTHLYLNTISLNEKSKKDLAIRIHGFVFPMAEAIGMYALGKTKQSSNTYDEISLGLKETLRRAKISLALNGNNSKQFVEYWKFLTDILQRDAAILKDEHLQNIIKEFKRNTMTLEVKK